MRTGRRTAIGMARAQAMLAFEEARGAVGLAGLLLIVVAPFVMASFFSGLAADATGRVASDVAYLAAMLGVHGVGLLLGALAAAPPGGESDAWRARGATPFSLTLGRALGIGAWAILPTTLAAAAAATAASVCGASDGARCWVAWTGFPVTFGLAAILASILPRSVAQLATAFLLVVGHLIDAGAASVESGALLGWMERWSPSLRTWDAWPGETVTAGEWLARAGYGALCGVTLVYLAAIAAGVLRSRRTTSR